MAVRTLATSADFSKLLSGKRRVTREEMRALLRPVDKRREPRLARALRKHWPKGITDPVELELRDSLDWALTPLQLLELAVEMGYLSADDSLVRTSGRKHLAALLWSDAAVSFVTTYQYMPIRYLAERVGIDLGLRSIAPPAIVGDSDVQFAVFLDIYRDWIESPSIGEWLLYLDDYRPRSCKGVFRRAWESESFPANPTEARWISTLAHGACRFLRFLGEVFVKASPEQQASIGLFFAYWLGRFFGYRVRNSGYTSRGVSWAGDATQFRSNPKLIATKLLKLSQWHGDDPSEATTSESLLNTKSLREQYVGQLASDIITLEEAWTATLKRLNSER